ncbi:hypothetical protein MST27_02470 [Pseudomonas sp. PS1]|uniref:Uncharacterized protein n=1 Tax=Stutzerimonas marianensis TaxID=2929513 RepID=A0A9X1W0E7_9GAMM|nr:hypothetical protein [Pseudomonas marianensis]MCJ0972235.1 hypothetical protein [Pseudomonas marianensis]
MPDRNEQLDELLVFTARSISQLTEALNALSFELMASEDPAVRIASRRMVSRIAAVQAGFEQRWRQLGPLPEGEPVVVPMDDDASLRD